MNKFVLYISLAILLPAALHAQQTGSFNGVENNMGNLFRLSNAKSRSISPENLTGAKGQGGKATEGTGSGPARELGQGLMKLW